MWFIFLISFGVIALLYGTIIMGGRIHSDIGRYRTEHPETEPVSFECRECGEKFQSDICPMCGTKP